MGIESIFRTVKMFALAGLVSLVASCTPLRKPYIEPRLGIVAPVAEKQKEYGASFIVGAAYGVSGIIVNGLSKEKIGLEASLDYFHSSEQYIETNSLLLRADATYQIKVVSPAVHLTVGLALLSEFSDIDIPAMGVHDEQSNTSVGLGFGANLRFDAADIEDVSARLSYIIVPGSENVKGMLVLTGGYRF